MMPASRPAPGQALVLGNSDGIGKALVNQLLEAGWQVTGFSRSVVAVAPNHGDAFAHHTGSVADPGFPEILESAMAARGPFSLCVYCIGTAADNGPMDFEEAEQVLRTNFNAVLKTLQVVMPAMASMPPDRHGVRGHFIALSSMADSLRVSDAGSYSGSKAGLSNYLESLGLHLHRTKSGLRVTNVRFGFVDTKMARASHRPFMVTPNRAAGIIMRCVRKRPVRHSYPWTMDWVVRILQAVQSAQIRLQDLFRRPTG